MAGVEALVCVHDLGNPSNLTDFHHRPKQGDVITIQLSGFPWGEGELGGPNWTKPLVTTYSEDIAVQMADGFDMTQPTNKITVPADLWRAQRNVVGESIGPRLILPDDTGLPGHFSDFTTQGQLVIFTRYTRLITGSQVVPMSQHPLGNHPHLRIIKFTDPSITIAAAGKMLVPEADVPGALKPSPYIQYRQWFFDKTKIPASVLKTYWNDDTRAAPFITVPHTLAQLNAIVTQRPAIPFT